MREALIVSAARTPIGRAFRGAFNQTPGATMAGHAVKHAMERAAIEPGEVEDVVMGCGLPEGATGNNIGRNRCAARRLSGTTVPAETVSRFCASGLDAIAIGAKRVIVDGASVIVAGGVESISMVQNDVHVRFITEDWLLRHHPTSTRRCSSPPTSSRSGIRFRASAKTSTHCRASSEPPRRKPPDASTPRSCRCLRGNPCRTARRGAVSEVAVDLKQDEGNRPDTTLDGLAALKGAVPGVADTSITAGNSVAALRRRGGRRDRRLGVCRAPQSPAAGNLSRLRGGGDRAGRNGNRAGSMPCRNC